MRIDIGQLEFIDLDLRKICVWLEKETGYEFTITSQFRMDDDGTHGTLPLRAIDLRQRNRVLGGALARMVNRSWQYDPERPNMNCAEAHGQGTNFHLHLQTHPNTRRRL